MNSYSNMGERQDFHINGNALYKVGDNGFKEYMERVRAFYPSGIDGVLLPGCATGHMYELGVSI